MKLFAILLVVLNSLNTFAFDQSKIIGNDDLVLVNAQASNIPFKYKNLVNAFGLLSMGCTATHIGHGYVLTAGHCFLDVQELVKNSDCPEITVQWGVREGISSYLKSTCEKVVIASRNSQRNSYNDFAIIKVSPVPEVAVNIELDRKTAANDVITIFSHPEWLPLHWSQTCVVESELDTNLPADLLQHKCDTKPGSSGAVIIDATTNKIIGIHDGGYALDRGSGMNFGTFLTNSEVKDALKEIGFN